MVADLNLSSVPGYDELVQVLEDELIKQDIHYSPDSYKEATLSFLYNPKVLCRLFPIQFSKTHMYDSLAVIKTMEMSAAWLCRIHKNRLMIPPDFDFEFLFKGL